MSVDNPLQKLYAGFRMKELDRRLLRLLDDVVHRAENDGKPLDESEAWKGGYATFEQLTAHVKAAASVYRTVIVKNRFSMARREAVEPLMDDPGKPPMALLEFVRGIAGLMRDGKMLTSEEAEKYARVFKAYPNWRGAEFYPHPSSAKSYVCEGVIAEGWDRRDPRMPSREDDAFVRLMIGKARKGELIRATEADQYEEIMAKATEWYRSTRPARVRGSDLRRIQEQASPEAVSRRVSKSLGKQFGRR